MTYQPKCAACGRVLAAGEWWHGATRCQSCRTELIAEPTFRDFDRVKADHDTDDRSRRPAVEASTSLHERLDRVWRLIDDGDQESIEALNEVVRLATLAAASQSPPVCKACDLPVSSVDGYGFCVNCVPNDADMVAAALRLAECADIYRSSRVDTAARLEHAERLERVVRWLDAVRLSR